MSSKVALRWLPLALGLALIVGGVASLWFRPAYQARNSVFVIGGGAFSINWSNSGSWNQQPGWRCVFQSSSTERLLWFPYYTHDGPLGGLFIVPLWVPLIPLVAWTVWTWRRIRRHGPGTCHACGYDLTGNRSGRCPECGADVVQPGIDTASWENPR
jgi:hypothetical protein